MGAGSIVGSFQVGLEEAEKELPIEKSGDKPGADNPQIGEVVIKAPEGNAGIVYIGQKGVTAANGYPLKAGEVTPRIPVMGIGQLFGFATKAKDRLAVLWVGP